MSTSEDGYGIPFPFDPYPQQRDLMNAIYETIEASSSGCFESPTGTGKSLSVICSTLHWQKRSEEELIRAHVKECEDDEKESQKSAPSSDDWLADIIVSGNTEENAAKKKIMKDKKRALEKMKKMTEKIDKARAVNPANLRQVDGLNRANAFRSGTGIFTGTGTGKKEGKEGKETLSSSRSHALLDKSDKDYDLMREEEEEFGLQHYDSEDEKRGGSGKQRVGGQKAGSKARNSRKGEKDEFLEFEDPFGLSDSEDDNDDEEGSDYRQQLSLPQVFYCSRTHSQISQFVSEIRKTAFGCRARVITLGSRKNMCINTDVAKLSTDSKISDRCLDMQKSNSSSSSSSSSTKSSSASVSTVGQGGAEDNSNSNGKKQRLRQSKKLAACKFHSRKLEEQFAQFSMGSVRDIEELVSLGKDLGACPYYATRKAVRLAQVVCLPYNSLVNADSRASMGIDLRNSVVIFDEAHNLVEAVNHTHSAELSVKSLAMATQAVNDYLQRFQVVLTGKNLYYVSVLAAVLKKLTTAAAQFQRKEMKKAKAAADADAERGISSASAGAGTGAAVGAGSAYRQATTASNTTNVTKMTTGAKDGTSQTNQGEVELLSANDFIFRAKLDNINLFKLRRHVLETNLVAKIGGYAEATARRAAQTKEAEQQMQQIQQQRKGAQGGVKGCKTCVGGPEEQPDADFSAYSHALRSVLSMLTCLTNTDSDGRVVLSLVTPPPPREAATAAGAAGASSSDKKSTEPVAAALEPAIRFVLLNPAVHFKSIVDQARSVVLLGGTLKPFDYMTSCLFHGSRVRPRDVRLFSCGHVVPKSSVSAITIGVGPNGTALEFTHHTRSTKAVTDELAFTLLQTARSVPHGLVVFFTSYAYMDSLEKRWTRDKLFGQLDRQKRIFIEPRTVSESDKVWADYSTSTLQGTGAMLWCVMGGKLSEGINFSDHLARGVVVVGMPFPDGRDPILQEKMRHADAQAAQDKAKAGPSALVPASSGGTQTATQGVYRGGAAGRALYEAMCMKSVNQSIGRSIRHGGDYASILLLDRRYGQESVVKQLPQWISRSIVTPSSFGEVLNTLNEFFSKKKSGST